jgi:hypothetical protein
MNSHKTPHLPTTKQTKIQQQQQQNITHLLGCVPQDHVSHEHNSPLIMEISFTGAIRF